MTRSFLLYFSSLFFVVLLSSPVLADVGAERAGKGSGIRVAYQHLVMKTLRPNWKCTGSSHKSCRVTVSVNPSGKVTSTVISRSSGDVQFDSSCIRAIMATSSADRFPKPPNQEYQLLSLYFYEKGR